MRSLLAVLFSFTLFATTSVAQGAPQGSPQYRPPVAPPRVTTAFTALYECDGDQCENPRSGGAVWLFSGSQGQGMWIYQAVTKLTVVKFDGKTIHIHRADPAGTYSSNYVADHGEFTADYFATITGNRVEGKVYWGGNLQSTPSPWHATIVGADFCTPRAGKCPLRPDQLSVLGRRASEAKMYAAAFRCFQIAAEEGDADGKGFEATMMMNGWGGEQSASKIMALLHESAERDSYPGEKGLARAYAEGKIVAKNPARAAFWDNRANSRQARLKAQQKSQEDAQLAGKVLNAAAVFSILETLMSNDEPDRPHEDFQFYPEPYATHW